MFASNNNSNSPFCLFYVLLALRWCQLILNGENDTQTPVEQAMLLQQKLTEINHPDHTLITYPNLGHEFYPSSQWQSQHGPIQQYVLADLYSWLEAHSGFTNSSAAPHTILTLQVKVSKSSLECKTELTQ